MMEHPGLSVRELKETLTLQQIQEKINELISRQTFAMAMGKQDLCDQVTMVIGTYQRAQDELIDEQFKENPGGAGKIDIS